jgi:1-hydroxycarotenoid 3,4-desaturase
VTGHQVIIIGAGVAGLACAIDLARQGREVTVVEKAPRPGGKMREVAVAGALVDSGPTVFTMRWVFEALFEDAGARLDDALALRRSELIARHAWDQTQRLDLFTDIERSADAIGALAGAREAAGYRAFCRESQRVYETLRDSFIRAQQPGLVGLSARVGLSRPAALAGLRPFETLWSALGDHFRDARLRQLYGRYATYCGSSPYECPATLMLIAHVEREGVWTIDGGMYRLAEAMERLARSLGVSFRYGAEVARIETARGRASGVSLAGGERLAAGAVVVNADAQALAGGAFGAEVAGATPARPPERRSLSALTWSMAARTRGFPLVRHNVFFSGDYKAEFDDILRGGRLPAAPTVYVCAQDRDEGRPVPEGPERLFIIVNAPANGDRRDLEAAELEACEGRTFDHLNRLGLEIGRAPGTSERTTPAMFERLFPATGGALYGPATHGWAAAFQRPGSKLRVPGLYLAGGGAHPGAGIPMAALSGRLAAARLIQDQDSTRPFRRGAMSGGTSTPPATTAATP